MFFCLPIFIITLHRSCSLYRSPFLYNPRSFYLPHLSRYLFDISSHRSYYFVSFSPTHTQSVYPSACIILLRSLFILILPCRPCSSPPLKETTTRLLAFVSLSCHSRYLLSICIILTISSFAFHDAILGLFPFSLSFYFSL